MATVHKQRSRLHAVADKAAVAAPVERKCATHDHAYSSRATFDQSARLRLDAARSHLVVLGNRLNPRQQQSCLGFEHGSGMVGSGKQANRPNGIKQVYDAKFTFFPPVGLLTEA